MRIDCIFALPTEGNKDPNAPKSVLLAIAYGKAGPNEFDKAFEQWNDPEYVESFFEDNKSSLVSYYDVDSSEFIEWVQEDAEYFDAKFQDCKSGLEELDNIFEKLSAYEYAIDGYTRHKIKENNVGKPTLRMYAIKFDSNCYMVTGSAIKKSQRMDQLDINKLEQCRNFLIDKKIINWDTAIEYVEIEI